MIELGVFEKLRVLLSHERAASARVEDSSCEGVFFGHNLSAKKRAIESASRYLQVFRFQSSYLCHPCQHSWTNFLVIMERKHNIGPAWTF